MVDDRSCTQPSTGGPLEEDCSWHCNLVGLYTWTLSQSPCTALTAGICLPLGLCKGTVSGIWKTVEISIVHMNPQCNGTWGNPNLSLDQPITKAWCQPIRGHVSYPTDSPVATRLGLCNSLASTWSILQLLMTDVKMNIHTCIWWCHCVESLSRLLAFCTGNPCLLGSLPKRLLKWKVSLCSNIIMSLANEKKVFFVIGHHQGPLLLPWFNFNPCMDK